MSTNNSGKDYEDYFKALEDNLTSRNDKSKEKTDISQSEIQKQSKPVAKRRKKHFYKVIRLHPFAVLLAFVLVISVTVGIIFSLTPKSKSKRLKDTAASKVESTVSDVEEEIPKITYNETVSTVALPTNNDCVGAIIVSPSTHEIIAQRNPHQHLYPASTTKIMTLLVACENITNYDDTFVMSLDITDPLYVAEATVAGFLPGEIITMTDMLYGLILPSGADAAVGLAIKIAGSEEAFVELMNKKAEDLGLNDTHFVNTSGLYDKNHYTSAYDMAIILETALQNPLCKKILSTYQYTTKVTPQHPSGILLSATLFNYMYGTEPETSTILGGKTGFVNESGYCIASYGSNNTTGNEYIVVTLKNSSRWPAIHGQIGLYKEFAK